MDKQSSFDWKGAKRSLPFKGGTNFVGSKKTAPCPHCGSHAYGYHGGRFKMCPTCGFDKIMERLFDHVKYLVVRGRQDELKADQIERSIKYYNEVYKKDPKLGE